MYEDILDKMLIFKKVTSNVIRCHQMSGKVLQNKWETQGRQEKKSMGRRGDVPQGKGQTACMARKKKGAGTAVHAEQRELKPPVFSCGPSYTYKKISGGTGYGMVSI